METLDECTLTRVLRLTSKRPKKRPSKTCPISFTDWASLWCMPDQVKEVLQGIDEHIKNVQRQEEGERNKVCSSSCTNIGVGELQSRLRTVKLLAGCGLQPCCPLGLTTSDQDGNRWGFSKPEIRNSVLQLYGAVKPSMRGVSPMCAAFGVFQGFNYCMVSPGEVAIKLRGGGNDTFSFRNGNVRGAGRARQASHARTFCWS